MEKEHRIKLVRIAFSAGFFAISFALPGYFSLAALAISYIIAGYDVLFEAFCGIIHFEPFDECFLMSVATIGAAALAEYSEAVAVMLLYQMGELLCDLAVSKSRKSIAALSEIRPDHANIEENGEIIRVLPENVAVGTVITVLPGERVPIDGVVVFGESSLDTSAITGESLPQSVFPGAEVHSGCINQTGVLKIRTSVASTESTVSRILKLVEQAETKKSRAESFISRFAKIYTPAVCAFALILAVLPPVLFGAPFSDWVKRALTFLVISCPCALVISVPLAFFACIGCAGRQGILIKGSEFIEALSHAKTVLFDKTGTLTEGIFEVQRVLFSDDPTQTMSFASSAESYSSHPLAQSIKRAFPDAKKPEKVEEIAGKGVIAELEGKKILCGNDRLMQEHNIALPKINEPGTAVFVAVDGEFSGAVIISDRIKENAAQVIASLRESGIKTVMLTGDKKASGEQIAEILGMDEAFCELLPEDKAKIAEALIQKHCKGEKLVAVGEGINDAPLLAIADAGIAMGALGSEAAIESADIVLTDDDLEKLCKAKILSRKCMCIVRENIYISIAVKVIYLTLGAVGFAGMGAAVFADVGVMLIAVCNSLRMMKG